MKPWQYWCRSFLAARPHGHTCTHSTWGTNCRPLRTQGVSTRLRHHISTSLTSIWTFKPLHYITGTATCRPDGFLQLHLFSYVLISAWLVTSHAQTLCSQTLVRLRPSNSKTQCCTPNTRKLPSTHRATSQQKHITHTHATTHTQIHIQETIIRQLRAVHMINKCSQTQASGLPNDKHKRTVCLTTMNFLVLSANKDRHSARCSAGKSGKFIIGQTIRLCLRPLLEHVDGPLHIHTHEHT